MTFQICWIVYSAVYFMTIDDAQNQRYSITNILTSNSYTPLGKKFLSYDHILKRKKYNKSINKKD